MMKKLVAILMVAMPIAVVPTIQQAVANDGAYYMSGNQLVPMHTTQIDVKKEVLNIRRDGDDIVVDVHYELYNKGKPVSLLVGFEAMPPSGDVNGLPKNGEHPYMKDFTAKVNGQSVQYDVALVPTEKHWIYDESASGASLNLNKPASPFYFKNGRINQEKESTLMARKGSSENEVGELYVYHFSANFQSGYNTIDHRYRFEASGSVDSLFHLDYVLTAINRWGDSTIDDFTLSLDMGDDIEYIILNSFFESSHEWQINGIGKVYHTEPDPLYKEEGRPNSTTVAMRDGRAVFHKRNFTPKGDLFVYAPTYMTYYSGFDASKDNLLLNYSWIDTSSVSVDDFSRRVLRNYPFARHGYVFKNKRLQAYYNRQPWYIPDPNYKADFAKLSQSEQEYIQRLDEH